MQDSIKLLMEAKSLIDTVRELDQDTTELTTLSDTLDKIINERTQETILRKITYVFRENTPRPWNMGHHDVDYGSWRIITFKSKEEAYDFIEVFKKELETSKSNERESLNYIQNLRDKIIKEHGLNV